MSANKKQSLFACCGSNSEDKKQAKIEYIKKKTDEKKRK